MSEQTDIEIAQQADANIRQKREADEQKKAADTQETVAKCEAMFAEASENTKRVERAILPGMKKFCDTHRIALVIDLQKSAMASFRRDVEFVWKPCPECERIEKAKDAGAWITRAGVPMELAEAAFENWKPRTKHDMDNLQTCRRFAKEPRGFLILLGSVGVGKTHLAAAIMRERNAGIMRTQKRFISELRAKYSDEYAPDVKRKAMFAKLFIFDELEEMSGARDEWPAIIEVLDHRHGNKLPTVITSNLDWQRFKAVIGERMADRITESAFEGNALTFAGESMRRQMREKYFE